jgi:tetratricopeptide (TPR) repeat protein
MQRFVRAFAEGQDIEGALKSALNTDFDQMQTGFDQMLDKQFGKLRVALVRPEEKIDVAKMSLDETKAYAKLHETSFGAQMILGEALRKANDLDEAIAVFEKAAELAPVATGEDSPHQQIADIALQKKDKERAAKALEAVVAADFDNVDAARDLASLLRERTPPDPARLRTAYQRIVAIDPFDADAQSGLGRLLMQANQPEAAIAAFKAVVGLKPVDQAAAYTDLAEAYLKSGKRPEARRQTLAALEVAPSYERAQNLLLELAGSRP